MCHNPPIDAIGLEAPMGWFSMTYNINSHSSVFLFKVKSKRDVFSHWIKVNLLLPPVFSLLMCFQAACIHFPLFRGDTPTACWFSLATGEGALTVGCLSETYLSPNRKVTTSSMEMDITVDEILGYCSSLQGGYCLIVLILVYSGHMNYSTVLELLFG